MSKIQEYKCPKCFYWDDGFPIEKKRIECNGCGYIGDLKEFEAKSYNFYVQSIIRVIAFDKEDTKKELESFMEDLPYFDKLIKIVED